MGVFAHSEEVEEGDEGEVPDGLFLGCRPVGEASFCDGLWHCHGDGQLWLWEGVIFAEARAHQFEGFDVLVWGSEERVVPSVQFAGLADGPERDLDSRARDLIASTVVARPHPSSKTGGESCNGLV